MKKLIKQLTNCCGSFDLFFLFGALFVSLSMAPLSALAGTVKIGNSNTGGDLERVKPLEETNKLAGEGAEKILQSSRIAAVVLLNQLNVNGIPGLGTLLPEVKNTEMFIAEQDVNATIQDDFHKEHLNVDGKVYARTLAVPHASTRFFPVAFGLSQDQLIKLHIHEGLHRALHGSVRENEGIVAQMTLAITSPGASHDSIRSLSDKLLPPVAPDLISFRKDLYPSQISYGVRQFSGWQESGNASEVKRSHAIRSHLYPFGSDDNTFGLGVDFSLLERGRKLASGPLTLSFRWKAVTARKFDFDFFGSASLNTLSFQELKDSPFGRDVYELGFSMRRELKYFYVENSINFRNGGAASQKVGLISYSYNYGEIIEPAVHVGFVRGPWHFGGYLNFLLADNFWVEGGSFTKADTELGRFRLVTAGPELRYRSDEFVISFKGAFLVNATQDADLSNLGLLGLGVGKGWLELGIGIQF
jgi:hypothetical protein